MDPYKSVSILDKFLTFFNPKNGHKIRVRSKLSESKVVENLLSFKYRRFLVERRLWFCYSQLLFSLYGLIFGMLLAQFEMREIEDHIIADRVCNENGECENARLANYTLEDITTVYQESYRSVIEPFRITVSISTAISMILTICYHMNEIQIYKFDNSLSPTIRIVSKELYLYMVCETGIIAIHPFWAAKNIVTFVEFPELYFFMLIRVLFFYRAAIVQSALFFSAKVETVASLNRVSTGALNYENTRLILRSAMAKKAAKIMFFMVSILWVSVAWCISLAEIQFNIVHHKNTGVEDFISCFWLVPITFTTIGYGDFAPKSGFGRAFCIFLAISGAFSTAILIGLMNDKLAMTRRERMLHRVLQ